MVRSELRIIAIDGLAEIRAGDAIADLIAAAAAQQATPLRDDDCLVVTQKIVSKSEARIVPVDWTPEAKIRLVEQEAVRVLRRRGELLITETTHGFICANSGVDLSNVEDGTAALLPVDSDRSARRVRDRLAARHDVNVAVVISDTFGRPWRRGLTDVAIGVAGIAGVEDLRGHVDDRGRELNATEIAIADEVASAAELVMGKSDGVPAAIVRGLDASWRRDASVDELIRPAAEDLFR